MHGKALRNKYTDNVQTVASISTLVLVIELRKR